ncbi:MAG: hypothetical protein ACKO6N_16880, partial [Myxococcota bacterium]
MMLTLPILQKTSLRKLDRAAKPLEFFARVYQVERLAGRRGATGLERVALREQYARPNLMALLRH